MKAATRRTILSAWEKFLPQFKAKYKRPPSIEEFHRHLDATNQRDLFSGENYRMEHRLLQEVVGSAEIDMGGEKLKQFNPIPRTLINEETGEEEERYLFDDLNDMAYVDAVPSFNYQLTQLTHGPKKLKRTVDHWNDNVKPTNLPPIQLDWTRLLPDHEEPDEGSYSEAGH